MTLPPLRGYQEQNAAAILACLERGRSPLYALPTGGGKTRIAVEVVSRVVNAGWRVLFLVHRRELLRQASRALASAGLEVGVVDPDHEPSDATVHVASVDTLGRRLGRYDDWLASHQLVIADEAHHVVAPKWTKVIDACGCLVLGLTATPWRTDGKGLGALFDEIVRGPSIKDLVALGALCPSIVYQPPVVADVARVKKRGGDYDVGALAALLDRPEAIEPALVHYARFAPGEPCVAFCVSVEHARNTAAMFSAAGWAAVSIDGASRQDDRDAAIAGLADGSVQILASCDLISEGVDVPAVSCAILLRPTLSTGLYQQQVGRILRPAADKPASIIIDCAANVRAHGMPDAVRTWSLADGIGRERIVDATRRCPKCWRVHAWEPACPSCAYRYRVQEQPRTLPTDVVVARPGLTLTRADILQMTQQQIAVSCKTEAELRLAAEVKGYKGGWVYWIIQEREKRRGRSSGHRRWW